MFVNVNIIWFEFLFNWLQLLRYLLTKFFRVISSSSVRTIFNVLTTLSLKMTNVATPLEWKLSMSPQTDPQPSPKVFSLTKWYYHSAHTTQLDPLYSKYLYDFALASQKSLTELYQLRNVNDHHCFMDKTTTFLMIPSLCNDQGPDSI